MSDTLFDLIAGIVAVLFFSCITILCIVHDKELREISKVEIKQCTNINIFRRNKI